MKIGMLGCGTVGSGVYEIINNNSRLKTTFEVAKILVRNISKYKQYENIVTTNVDDILENKDIDIVVEVMGGHDFAYNAMKKALANKKHVVTANKEVVSMHLEELLELAHKNNVYFLFEATVAGGIPVINNILNNSKVNTISEVNGILNGSTNYILSLIQNNNVKYDDAIKSAFDKGFLEADPTDDLHGLDMVRKIAILSMLSYLGNVKLDNIYNYPISGVTDEFVSYVNKNGYKLRYTAQSVLKDNNVGIRIEPAIYKSSTILGNINNEINIVQVKGCNTGELNFTGPGAGKLPTANSIVTDLMMIVEERGYIDYVPINELTVVSNEMFVDEYLVLPNENIDPKYVEKIEEGFVYTKKITAKELSEIVKKSKFYARING